MQSHEYLAFENQSTLRKYLFRAPSIDTLVHIRMTRSATVNTYRDPPTDAVTNFTPIPPTTELSYIFFPFGRFDFPVKSNYSRLYQLVKMAFGDYPAAYNPQVHGPYDPARFYGKGK